VDGPGSKNLFVREREDVEVVDAFSKEADINLEFSLFE
jgi:hypothetical protein